MVITAAAAGASEQLQIVALLVGLVQTVALAVIADRSRRVRSLDRRPADDVPAQREPDDEAADGA